MNNDTRRAIAYLAAKLIDDRGISTVYDCAASKPFRFSGNTHDDCITVYDHEHDYHMTGSGYCGNFNIYQIETGNYLVLNVMPNEFRGFDNQSGKHFTGRIVGSSVCIFDYEYLKSFYYSI